MIFVVRDGDAYDHGCDAYKVQMEGVVGWGDVKESEDGSPYKTPIYSQREAEAVASEMSKAFTCEHRAVPFDTPSDEDFYE